MRPTVGRFFGLPIASTEEHLSTTYEPSKGIFFDDLENKKSGSKLDPGLYCFTAITQFHGIPADSEQIAHALAIDPRVGMSEADMLRAARSLKLKARAATVNSKQLTKLPLPLIVGMKDEKFAVLAQIVAVAFMLHDRIIVQVCL